MRTADDVLFGRAGQTIGGRTFVACFALVPALFLFAPADAAALCSGVLPNGVGNPGEQCDDGNLVDTDGCSNLCVENPGYACSCPAGQLTGVTVDDPQTLLAIIGGSGGGAFADRCPTGQVTVGFEYTVGPFSGAHDWITASRAQCATLAVAGTSVTITPAGFTPIHGAGAGTVNALTCPAGSVVAGFIGDSRNEEGFVGIAGVQLYCATLTVGGTGRVVVGTPVPGPSARPGGGAITVVGPSTCPAGTVVSGNQGRAGAIIDQFTMLCQEVYTNCGAPMTCSGICGDGLLRGMEMCDDANLVSADGCSSVCAIEPGYMCSGAGPLSCSAICGDGAVRGAETCDDANLSTGDGCSSMCMVEVGFTCPMSGGTCAPICGDALLRGAEMCDDGNTTDADGCSSMCATEPGYMCSGTGPGSCEAICGDGAVRGAELCDDGNVTSADGCSALCAPEQGFTCPPLGGACAPVCGDALLRGAEMCDDGNLTSADGCSSMCATEPGYMCSGTGPGSCAPICGDGSVLGSEACDDANVNANDGCSATCTIETGYTCSGGGAGSCTELCGDGLVVGDEACDDANTTASDGCTDTCTIETGYACTGMGAGSCSPICGDGVVLGGEACDDANVVASDGCSATCTIETGYTCTGEGASSCTPICGDGLVLGGEACDDGNLLADDGCSALCAVEPGFTCTGTMPSVCIECVADAECDGEEFCDTSINRCVGKYMNGTMLPTIAEHDPVLDGICNAAVGMAVCLSGACDELDDACGLLNSTPGCTVADPSACRSGTCGADMACGLAEGEGPCTEGDAEIICRSGTCSVNGTCRAPTGCNADGDCLDTQFCNTETHLCVALLTSGTPIPTIAGHDPVLDGMCSSAVAEAVCAQSVCEEDDDRCGLSNGSPCGAAEADEACRSGICFDGDVLCGLPAGEACTLAIECRSNVCSSQGLCGACGTDADCGNAMSGQVCDDTTKLCAAGCRGVDGNGCGSNQVCTSQTSEIGSCVTPTPDAGVEDGGVDDAATSDATSDATVDANEGGPSGDASTGGGIAGGAMCAARAPSGEMPWGVWAFALGLLIRTAQRSGRRGPNRR